MNKPLISVVVPVYNVEEWLPECIESILVQDEERFELVAVNDGSTDSSREVIARYADADKRIRIIDQKNEGLAGARNTGVRAARGRYLAFVDSDDFVSPNYLSAMLGNLNAHDADISVCGRAVYANGKSAHHVRPGFANMELDPKEAARALNSYKSFDMSMCGKLFDRKLFKGISFPEGKNSEDQFVCYKLLLKSRCVYYEDAPLYYYRHRTGSISRGSKVNTFPIEAAHEQLEYFKEQCPALAYAGETCCFFSQVAVFNAFAMRGRGIPVDLERTVRIETPTYLKSVLFNRDIPTVKKAQAIVFCACKPVYKYVYLSRRG